MSKNSEGVIAWRQRIRKKIIEAMGGECQIPTCSYKKCQAAFDLHHIDPKLKDFTISQMTSNPKRWIRIAEEIAKCILLCVRCHREVHAGVTELPEEFKKYGGELEKFYEFQKRALLKHQMDMCPICAKGKHIRQKTCSPECRARKSEKTEWPNPTDLERLVWEIPSNRLSKQMGVSDKAIQKRCRRLGIPKPPPGYWQRSREEQTKIFQNRHERTTGWADRLLIG
jgi:hypothetical protein